LSKPDDLEAVRTIAAALAGFSADDQERIIRWAREKVGLAKPPLGQSEPPPEPSGLNSSPPAPVQTGPVHMVTLPAKNIKSFVDSKNPNSANAFAATIAYYYRFEAPPAEHADEINAEILQNACRLTGRDRLKDPLNTLNNAKKLGLLDSGSEKGKFGINSVGENLVAMSLPASGGRSGTGSARTNRNLRRTAKPSSPKRK
jgi:hypothetical protein